MTENLKLGLVVNPLAGIGGRAGLKGSDGIEIQRLAKASGFASLAIERTVTALSQIPKNTVVVTVKGEMGETAARLAGLAAVLVWTPSIPSSAQDTVDATKAISNSGVDLILFAGGDGTARDVYEGLAENKEIAVLGIPSGVKMYSGCFGINPVSSGRVAASYLSGNLINFEDREVLDIDEQSVRKGFVATTLQGIVRVPVVRGRTQSRKTASSSTEQDKTLSVAQGFVSSMQQDHLYILGPGGTTRSIAANLGISKTPLGVDIIQNGKIVASDCNESEILEAIQGKIAHAVLSVIGGQGIILGRGNQQISPSVIRSLSEPKIILVATPNKLASINSRIFIDTGDSALDGELQGFYKAITGFKDEAVVQAEAID
jgi:predicted polyphosphate/ATP-dependent NAD kinase